MDAVRLARGIDHCVGHHQPRRTYVHRSHHRRVVPTHVASSSSPRCGEQRALPCSPAVRSGQMPMRTRPRYSPLAEHLRESGSALSRAEILSRFGDHDLRRGRSDGLITRLLPDVYAHASCAASHETRTRAASKWSAPAGALTGVAALWAFGAARRAPAQVSVQLPQALHLQAPPWVRVVRPTLPPEVLLQQGLRVTPAADALVQAWNDSAGLDAVGIVVATVGRRIVTVSDLAAAAGRRARVRSKRELASLIGDLDGGVTSFLEHWARTKVFPQLEFPELRWQVPVVAAGQPRILDALDPVSRLALEFDGAEYHSGDEARVSDITRDAELAGLGLTVLRFPYSALIGRPQWCRETYGAARRARNATPTRA